jgi:hypothetical protein
VYRGRHETLGSQAKHRDTGRCGMTVHQMVSESKALCGRLVTQGTGRDCGNCARVAKSREMLVPVVNLRPGVSLGEYEAAHAEAICAAHAMADAAQAYDASQFDDTITDGTIIVIRAERVVGVLVGAWPVAVTPARGEFHALAVTPSVANEYAQYTGPWAHAVNLAEAMGFMAESVATDRTDAPAPRKLRKHKSTKATRARRGGAW